MADETRRRPFYCGTQYADWLARNCDGCRKFDLETPFNESQCEIDRAIGESMLGDGAVSAEIALRMGFTDPVSYFWVCPEREEDSESGEAERYRRTAEAAGQLTIDALAGAKP